MSTPAQSKCDCAARDRATCGRGRTARRRARGRARRTAGGRDGQCKPAGSSSRCQGTGAPMAGTQFRACAVARPTLGSPAEPQRAACERPAGTRFPAANILAAARSDGLLAAQFPRHQGWRRRRRRRPASRCRDLCPTRRKQSGGRRARLQQEMVSDITMSPREIMKE